jgi:polyisoprenoid-binding protein YceI
MYKLILSLFLVVLFLQVGFAKNESFKVDVKESKLEWHGKKVTGEHMGLINIKGGTLQFKDDMLVGGEFEVDMKTIVNLDLESEDYNTKLVNHLKSDDFFSVEKFPIATLKITEVKSHKAEKSDANYWVKGELTIKGKTNPIEFAAKVDNNEKGASASATMVVDRSKYDVRYGSGSFFEGLGDKLIYDEFDMKVSLSAVK